jgi:hypothetical protein
MQFALRNAHTGRKHIQANHADLEQFNFSKYTRILRAAGRFSWSPLGSTANSYSGIIALHLADELTGD